MTGFFSTTVTHSKKPPSEFPRCGICNLLNNCRSPKIPVNGQGRKGILIIGDAPGDTEDRQNRFFAGHAGVFLRDALGKFGIDLERDCWSTSALICKPPE